VGLGEGLDEYNPTTGIFTHYRHLANDPQSLGSGNVNCILEDHQGRLWVGTQNGLDLLDKKTEKFIHYRYESGNPKSLSNNFIWNIYEDHAGVIWIAAGYPFFKRNPLDGSGLNRMNPDGSFTHYLHDPKDPNSLISNSVRAMFEDSRGVFWIGTSGDGLHTMDRKTGRFERYPYNPKKPDQLSRPPLKKDKFAFDNDQVTFITEDPSGSIWMGTMWSGLNRYDTATKKITHYEGSNGFPDSSGWNAYVSRDGILWISTQQNNLFRVGPFAKTINNMNHGVPTASFLEDKDGFLWAGTDGNGLLQFDVQGKLVRHFQEPGILKYKFIENRVNCLSQSSKDSIWLGTGDDNPVIFNTITKQFYSFSLGLNIRDLNRSGIWSIFRDKEGFRWFATGHGIVRYSDKDGSLKRYRPDEKDSGSIGANRTISFLEDRSGGFWVGTVEAGVNRLNRQTDHFRHYLPGLNGICLYQDTKGTIWAGTNNGLFQYNEQEDRFFPFFDPQSEFNTELIFSIIEDNAKNLWVTTRSAILKLNPERDKILVYASKFGIPRGSISANAIYKTREGKILIGNDHGFYSFFPEELDKAAPPSEIIITGLFINNRLVLPGQKSPLQRPVEELEDLILQYDQNNFAFNFASIDYQAPEKIKYYTMLEGYDDTWREAVGEKSSYYFNVSSGRKYIFHVKAINLDGEEIHKTVTIQINPPWWETWWFRITAIFFAAAMLYGLQYRSRHLKKRNILLEHKVMQRTDELNNSLAELKTTQDQLIQAEKMASLGELTSGIAHEIKNPLNFINNFSEINLELITEIEEKTPTTDEPSQAEISPIIKTLKKNSEKINHHSKRIDGIVKGMLQHSRLGNANKEPVNINTLCDESLKLAYHGFRAKEKTFSASFETRFDPDLPMVMVMPQDLGRVLLNLMNNAFYAVNEKKIRNSSQSTADDPQAESSYNPTVIVSTRRSGDKLIITISDNGMGIPPEIINKIFQPFFTTKPTGEGTGLGLSMSYDIISKSHGGEIRAKSKVDVGTDFEIILPIQQN
jgi:signal transduction histidine kinase/ligand-binding sensor domain-containing protein